MSAGQFGLFATSSVAVDRPVWREVAAKGVYNSNTSTWSVEYSRLLTTSDLKYGAWRWLCGSGGDVVVVDDNDGGLILLSRQMCKPPSSAASSSSTCRSATAPAKTPTPSSTPVSWLARSLDRRRQAVTVGAAWSPLAFTNLPVVPTSPVTILMPFISGNITVDGAFGLAAQVIGDVSTGFGNESDWASAQSVQVPLMRTGARLPARADLLAWRSPRPQAPAT